jgi:hypothetical protein
VSQPSATNRLIQSVVLRLPAGMLAQIDDAVRHRPVRIPRHTWVLEAVAEKLAREKAAQGGRHGT